MARSNHHNEAYDEGTRTKLFIYKSYLQAWLQVFLHTPAFAGKPLQFFDLFSGPGTDAVGNPGSPLILMEELQLHRDLIQQKSKKIEVVFNDYDVEKAAKLKQLCADRGFAWQPKVSHLEFGACYAQCSKSIGRGPSLVFLDQFGVKFVTRQIFNEIANRPQTDLLFFFASSHQRRFDDEFANELHIPPDTPYTLAHRVVASHYRVWAPKNYFVGHFSIKKGSNVYGLVFGTGHSLGMYKFLEVAWKVDAETGEADFPIEADCDQGSLFDGFKKTKLEAIRDELLDKIRAREFKFDSQVVMHCLTAGVLPGRVVPEVYKQLKAEGVLCHRRDNLPRYSHDAVTEPRNLMFSA